MSIKKEKILPFATIWTNLEDIMLSERSQTREDKHCIISDMESRKAKLIVPERRLVVARGWGSEKMGRFSVLR